MSQGDDLAPWLERARLEASHGEELADHPRKAVGLLGDDPEPPIRAVAAELVGVGADARERRLEVVADATEEVVLRRIELEQLAVLGLDSGEQLGIPDRDGDLAGEELEQILIGPLPDPCRRQMSDEDPELLAAELEGGPDRERFAGDPLLGRDLARTDEE